MDRVEVLEMLIKEVHEKRPVLVIMHDCPEMKEVVDRLYDIHNFYPQKYFKSIIHLGFGFFQGETEHGKFSFDAGGAMRDWHWDDEKMPKWIAYSPLRVDNDEVLGDLGYNFDRMEAALREILHGAPSRLMR